MHFLSDSDGVGVPLKYQLDHRIPNFFFITEGQGWNSTPESPTHEPLLSKWRSMDEGLVHSGDGDLSQHAVASMYKVCCKAEVIILCKNSCTSTVFNENSLKHFQL